MTVVKFLQRSFRDADVPDESGATTTEDGGRSLHHTLFHPIAGDAMSQHPDICGGYIFSLDIHGK